MMRIWIISSCCALALTLTCTLASAQERISLSEVIPALEGTEIGSIDLGEAPPPGAVRSISRTEVVAALRGAGRSADGLAIPRTSRIRREARELDAAQIESLARGAIREALEPCAIGELSIRSGATLPAGELSIRAEGPARPETGAAVLTLLLEAGGRVTRVTAQARLTCPEAVITPGSRVTVRVAAGAVRASAYGTARQRGRVGDRVRVRVDATGALLDARVIDASTVEVIR